ncbi:MAG: acetyl esterase, partial [Myxococcota bacterium]
YGLDRELKQWFSRHYLGTDADPEDPRISPLRAGNLHGLGPVYLATAGFDPLRDEGHAYAEKLQQDGVACEVICQGSMTHGFASFLGPIPQAREAANHAAAALRRVLLA